MTNNSYDFNNSIRDVAPDFDTLIANSPSFLRMLGSFGTTLNSLGEPVVKNTKYEWVDDSLTQYSSDVTNAAGTGTTLDLTSTEGFEAGSIIRFEKATGASVTEQVQVSSVDSPTSLTITRLYGGTTTATLVIGDIAILNSTPKNEGSSATDAKKHQSVLEFNSTEIFREFAELSETTKAILSYDRATSMATQMKAAMVRLARLVENAMIHGRRVPRTSSTQGTLGGMLQFISQAGGNIESTGGNLSQEFINNVIEEISQKGGMLINPMILCSPNQGRRISALNTAGANPTVFKEINDRTLGGYTSAFIGDLPVNDGAMVAKIFIAQNMIKDQVLVLDMNSIEAKVMRGLTSKDATLNGDDSEKQALTTELTLEVRNAKSAHGIITGLTL